MAGAEKRAGGSVKRTAWIGDKDALRQLVGAVQDLAEYAQRNVLEDFDAEVATRRADFERSYSYMASDPARYEAEWKRLEGRDRAEAESTLRVKMRVKQDRWALEHSGTPDDVLDAMDIDDVKAVEIGFIRPFMSATSNYALSVTLNKRGADAEFEGPDPRFVDMAGARLTDEFNLRRPKHWWVGTPRLYWIVVPVAVAMNILVGIWATQSGVDAVTTFVLQIAAVLGVSWGSVKLAGWLIRPFELVRDLDKSATRTRLRWIGAGTAWVAGTIIVPTVLALSVAPTP